MTTPTTDTVWGWLILSLLAVGFVGMAFVVGAGVLALWDAVLARHRVRVRFDAEMRRMRDQSLGFCQVIDIDGHRVWISSDQALDDGDRAAVDKAIRIIRDRLEESAWLLESEGR